MFRQFQDFTTDHRQLLALVAREAGFTAPLAVEFDEFHLPLVRAARRGEIRAIDGVLIRDWDPANRRLTPGVQLGMRFYEIEGIRFVQLQFRFDEIRAYPAWNFAVVDAKDYRRLYRIALRCRRDSEPPSAPPILAPEQAEVLWKNTIGYLDRSNLSRIKAYGGRARRGVLLTGSPGNGKTMACRWIWEECRRRRWAWRLVTPDTYREARQSCHPQEAVQELFRVEKRGVVFFDDMDLALRDRNTVQETEDQAIFLSAMDGISVTEGVVYVFTTNCPLELIDPAFKRPGRLDLVLHFPLPSAGLRRRLMERWHEEIRANLDMDEAVASADGYSFAEIEELKTLLIMNFMDSQRWDWSWALKQFDLNRSELVNRKTRHVGFGLAQAALGGMANGQ